MHSPVQNTLVDIRDSTVNDSELTSPNIQNNQTTTSHSVDEEALYIYKYITLFDRIVDKALGKFSKKNKKLSTFRKPGKNYFFVREPNFNNILLPLFKSGFSSMQDLHNLRNMYPLYDYLYKTIFHSINVVFITLFDVDPKWISHTSIPFFKKIKLMACTIYFNSNLPQMICYLAGQYTGDDRNTQTIV